MLGMAGSRRVEKQVMQLLASNALARAPWLWWLAAMLESLGTCQLIIATRQSIQCTHNKPRPIPLGYLSSLDQLVSRPSVAQRSSCPSTVAKTRMSNYNVGLT